MATAVEYPLIANSTKPVKTKLRALARKVGLRGDGTYETAQYVVAALADGNMEGAIALMSAHTPDEMFLVGQKAIALGADPATIHTLVQALAVGETIEIVDNKPVIKPKRPWWWWYALGAAAGVATVGGAVYAYRRWGSHAMVAALSPDR